METSSTSQEDLLQVEDSEQKAFSLLEVIQMTEANEKSNLYRLENEDGSLGKQVLTFKKIHVTQEGIVGAK